MGMPPDYVQNPGQINPNIATFLPREGIPYLGLVSKKEPYELGIYPTPAKNSSNSQGKMGDAPGFNTTPVSETHYPCMVLNPKKGFHVYLEKG